MKKKIIIALAVLAVLVSAVSVYLNSFFLPVKIKSLLVSSLEQETGKQVDLESLQFNIFKGLVLKNISITDGKQTLFSAREVSCNFLFLPIFNKNIIIPNISIRSPALFLERLPDNSLNLQSLFTPKPPRAGSKYKFFVYRIAVSNGNVYFQDGTLDPVYKKAFESLDLVANLSLPQGIKFRVSATLRSKVQVGIRASGDYKFPQKELNALLEFKNINPDDFLPYYRNLQVKISDGLIDARAKVKFKDDIFYADISAQTKGLAVLKDALSSRINADLEAKLSYNLKNRDVAYSGRAGFVDSSLSLPEPAGDIVNINGALNFDNRGFSSDQATCRLWGTPLQGKLKLSDYRSPVLNVDIASIDLGIAAGILKERFKFALPGQLAGSGVVSLRTDFQKLEGSLQVSGSYFKFDKPLISLEKINGNITFSNAKGGWLVESRLSADKGFKLDSQLQIENKSFNILKLDAAYLNSRAWISGYQPQGMPGSFQGKIQFDLKDLNVYLNPPSPGLQKANLSGSINASFSLTGSFADLNNGILEAKVLSDGISFYGLKTGSLAFDYSQADGIASISSLRAQAYGGTLSGMLKTGLKPGGAPFALQLLANEVDIGQLKKDTPLKEEDIAGILSGQLDLNGVLGELASFNGKGKLEIVKGKLWQLDLFRGLGSLLFVRDFSNIIFSEGTCSFTVADKNISTEDLVMKSSIANINGKARIGFDSTVDADLNVEILDKNVPLTGSFKDIATAIIGGAERFGVIHITGTLKEPRHRFQPAVKEIISSLTGAILGKTD